MKLLDCTLRDGGYYTDWDFNSRTIQAYIEAMNALPVDYLELGYRNNPSGEYLGKMGYSPVYVLRKIRQLSKKKLAVMLNEKSTSPDDLDMLLNPIKGLVDMIRIAIDPKNIDRAIILAKAVKDHGFEVAFNVMYMSTWLDRPEFLDKLGALDGMVDLFCMVDSFGGITPKETREIISIVKGKTGVRLGFHGHDNLQLGLINSLTALECGVEFVDATILGMGRGAGNLKTELLLTYLNAHQGLEVDFNVLGDVISTFSPLMEKHRWGTQLPYMISGANSIPQKEVMELVTNRIYPFNSIVRNLQNRKDHLTDNAKYPLMEARKYDCVLIVGGGDSITEHTDGIKAFISRFESVALVFATARHAALFQGVDADQYFCLLGPEAKRLSANVDHSRFGGKCILPPYPRKMGTEVPAFATDKTYELGKISFCDKYPDSCTSVAIQCAIELAAREIYVTGYDGYPGSILSEKEIALTNENKTLFQAYEKARGEKLRSLTTTLYPDLEIDSLYQYL